MKWILAAIAMFGFVAVAVAGENKSYTLNGAYGSIGYTGTVNRVEQGDTFVYQVIVLDLTFDPHANVNSTNNVASPAIRFFTSARNPGDGKAAVTFEQRVPTDIVLSSENRTASLSNIAFTVPKSALATADYAGLSVMGQRLLWPIYKDMRH